MKVRPHGSAQSLHEAIRDFSKRTPRLEELMRGTGRPPCDGLSLLRAYLAAHFLLTVGGPTDVFRLLRSNPKFARARGFLGPDAMKQPREPTSGRLPTVSVWEEYREVIARYRLWQLACSGQVQENLDNEVVATESTMAFDTTHVNADSHCGNVVPPDTKAGKGKKTKHRKLPCQRGPYLSS